MALLLTSVFGVTGCGSDDGEAPVESRIKNSTGDDPYGVITPQSYGEPDDAYGDDENAVPGEDIDNSVVSPQRLLFNKSAAEEFYDYYDDDSYYDSKPEKNLEKISLYYDPSHDDDIKDKISINLNIDDERLAHLLDLDDDEDNDDTTPPSYIYLGEDDRDIKMYAPASDDDVDLLDIDEG